MMTENKTILQTIDENIRKNVLDKTYSETAKLHVGKMRRILTQQT